MTIPLPTTADDRRRPCRFKLSDQYFARRQAAAESAAETVRPSGSPSPVRPPRPARPGANVATGNILADADAAFTMDLDDEPANADALKSSGYCGGEVARPTAAAHARSHTGVPPARPCV